MVRRVPIILCSQYEACFKGQLTVYTKILVYWEREYSVLLLQKFRNPQSSQLVI